MTPYCSCDQVFDRLTRGPFPSRAFPLVDQPAELAWDPGRGNGSLSPSDDRVDAAVEAHLAVCHECRTLAEALRPAVTLLSAAQDLPVYQGHLPTVAHYGTVEKSLYQASADERLADRRTERFTWPMAAIVLAGMIVGACLTQLLDSRTDAAKPSWMAWNVADDRTDDRWTFASLRLSESCREPRDRQFALVAGGEEDRVVCCTRCHASQAIQPAASTVLAPPVEMSRLLVACLACHEG